MNARYFPAAAIAVATITMWLHFVSPTTAQESSTPQAATIAAAAAAEPMVLSSGGADILKLSRAKVNDDVTIAFIQNGNRQYALSASEIVYLRQQGVSDRVLTAMLGHSAQVSPSPTSAPPVAGTTEGAASAPQYVAPPAATVVGQTEPASAVYVVPSTTTYYSFYDPWPYWYSSWPYWYSSWPYYYPYCSLGFYWGWGGCYSGYWNGYDNHGHGGHDGHNGQDGHGGHDGNNARPHNGTPPQHNRGSGSGGQPGVYASGGRSSGGANQARSDAIRAAGTAPTGRSTSYWSNNRNQSAVAPGGRPNAVASRGSSTGGPTSVGGRSANNRIIAGPSWGQAGAQSARGGYVPRTATAGSATAGSTRVWNAPGSQPGNRYVGSPTANSQRFAASPRPSSSNFGNRNAVSIGRPSMGSSYGSVGNSGGFRGGGSYGGSRVSGVPSGGGFQGGRGFHGGGGGGSRR